MLELATGYLIIKISNLMRERASIIYELQYCVHLTIFQAYDLVVGINECLTNFIDCKVFGVAFLIEVPSLSSVPNFEVILD